MKRLSRLEKNMDSSVNMPRMRVCRKHIFSAGFTFMEVLVSIVIFLILVSVAFAVMNAGVTSWFTGSIAVELRREIIRAFTVMDRDLKETAPAQTNLASGANAATITFTVPQDIDADGTVLNAAGQIEWSGNIIYALNANGQITRTDANGTRILANNITALLFTRPVSPVDILWIDVSAQKANVRGDLINDAERMVIKMRN